MKTLHSTPDRHSNSSSLGAGLTLRLSKRPCSFHLKESEKSTQNKLNFEWVLGWKQSHQERLNSYGMSVQSWPGRSSERRLFRTGVVVQLLPKAYELFPVSIAPRK